MNPPLVPSSATAFSVLRGLCVEHSGKSMGSGDRLPGSNPSSGTYLLCDLGQVP